MKWLNNSRNIVLMDNGSYEIKYSLGSNDTPIKFLHNCKFFEKNFNYENSYFLDDISNPQTINNLSKNFSRPMLRGLLYDVDLQIEIWEKAFKNLDPKLEFSESLFMFSYTPLCPDKVLEGFFQIIFEYFGYDALVKSIPHVYSGLYSKHINPDIDPKIQLVIDSGFSSTTIVPLLDSRPIYNSIKRIDVGGKLMTNYLKEAITNLTDLDLRKDFFLINLMKEEKCFVSKNFISDMKISGFKNDSNINKTSFILPEYRTMDSNELNKISKDKYSIELNSLRFIIPELIFNPHLIGIEEGGIQEGIVQALKDCHPDYKNLLYENIVTTGGNTNFPNFVNRLHHEIVPNSDFDSEIKIFDLKGKDSIESVIKGMKLFANDKDKLLDNAISNSEYKEIGFNVFWKSNL